MLFSDIFTNTFSNLDLYEYDFCLNVTNSCNISPFNSFLKIPVAFYYIS